MAKEKAGQKDIETYLEELKSISERLSDGELKLGEAVDLYREGVETAKQAEKLLEQYEKEIEIISTTDIQ